MPKRPPPRVRKHRDTTAERRACEARDLARSVPDPDDYGNPDSDVRRGA